MTTTLQTINQFNGDPRLFLDQDGADLKFIAGQPIMDGGYENAVIISLFTRPGWYGNIFTDSDAKKIGSDFEEEAKKSITLETLNNMRQFALAALQWLIDNGSVETIEVIVNNVQSNRFEITIIIKPPGSDANVLLLTGRSNNWLIQIKAPAHQR